MSSRAVTFLISLAIGLVTAFFISLIEGVDKLVYVMAFVLAFISSYLLITIAFEVLVFRQIDRVNLLLEKLKDKDVTDLKSNKMTFLNPIKSMNNEIYAYASLKQREIEELKRMANFRREFLADVSHELKTPIFAAQGYVHTLLDGAVEDKNVRDKFLRKAAKSLDGLDMMVQDLLVLSQMESGQITMKFKKFDVFELCKEVIDQLEDNFAKKDIEVELQKPKKERILVKGDEQQIYQVFINLISNSIKYTREGGLVKVYFKEGDNTVTAFVQDNGRGIPEEDQGRIFERFYRVDKSRSKHRGGTGLGLAIVKHILEAHNSEILVESKVAKGSVFSFELNKP